MSELTPIIKYEGPGVQKKEWTKRGTDLLSNMEKLNPGLAVRSHTQHYSDGSVIIAQTIKNDLMRLDTLDIKVPGQIVPRQRIVLADKLVPMLVFNNQDYVQVLVIREDTSSNDSLQTRVKYPTDTGTDIMETYEHYGINSDTIDIVSLKPIGAANCFVDLVVNSETTIDTSTQDPINTCENGAPDGEVCLNDLVYNICGGTIFYLRWFTGEVFWPPGGVMTYTSEYEYNSDSHFAITDNAVEISAPADLPAETNYYYHYADTTVITHPSPVTPIWNEEDGWNHSPYYLVESVGWFADCEDNDHVEYTVDEDTETGNEPHYVVIHSAVVKGAEGYTDYGTWGCIYADIELDTPNAIVYLALNDPKNGFRQYVLENVDYLHNPINVANVSGIGKVDIFDYFGKPYFVVSYVGLIAVGGT